MPALPIDVTASVGGGDSGDTNAGRDCADGAADEVQLGDIKLVPRDGSRSERKLPAGHALLVVKQPRLGLETATEAGEAAVGADDAMAGHDDR